MKETAAVASSIITQLRGRLLKLNKIHCRFRLSLVSKVALRVRKYQQPHEDGPRGSSNCEPLAVPLNEFLMWKTSWSCLLTSQSQEDPEDPEDPEDLEDPEDPEDPEHPEDHEDLEDPEDPEDHEDLEDLEDPEDHDDLEVLEDPEDLSVFHHRCKAARHN